jgi:glycosyltransferase involved in cell wall biosynthesis
MVAKTSMQIVHLSTAHIGGAGIAARRLNQGLNSSGYSSKFMAIANKSFVPLLNEISVNRTFTKKSKGALLARIQNQFSSRTYFTLDSVPALSSSDFKEFPKSSSIIHIHNWFNLADIQMFRDLLSRGYKLVFTLHDMRLFTGGCHYSLDCSNYLNGCFSCPYLPALARNIPPSNLKGMQELFFDYGNQIELISPSLWLQKLAIQSLILPAEKIHFIPNVHSLGNMGSPQVVAVERDQPNFINIGVASVDVNSALKGGDLVSEIMNTAKSREAKINFILLRDYDLRGINQENFWQDIDYLLVASRADNSPNVIHEAKLRHVPIIATKIGGITELLNSEFDIGIAIDELKPEIFLKLLQDLKRGLTSVRPRHFDLKYLDYVNLALQRTVTVYENLIKHS